MTRPQKGILMLMEFRGIPVAEQELVNTAQLFGTNPQRAVDMLVSYGYLRRSESGAISITTIGIEKSRENRCC